MSSKVPKNREFDPTYKGNDRYVVPYTSLLQHVQAKATRKSLWQEFCFQAVFFILFVAFAMLQGQIRERLLFTQTLVDIVQQEQFPAKPNSVSFQKFDDIRTQGGYHQWLNNIIFPIMSDPDPLVPFAIRDSMILFGLQLRQVAVNSVPCDYDVSSVIGIDEECYPLFSNANEDTTPRNDSFSTYEPNADIPMEGEFSNYPRGGHVIYFSPDDSASSIVKKLAFVEHGGFINRSTRALILSMIVFNPSYNLYAHARFLVEVPSGGAYYASSEISVAPLFHQPSPLEKGTAGLLVVVDIFIFLYILMVLWEFVNARVLFTASTATRRNHYVIWVLLDIVSIALFCVLVSYSLRKDTSISSYVTDQVDHGPDSIMQIKESVAFFIQVQTILAVSVLLFSFRIFKYIKLLPVYEVLSAVLRHVVSHLVHMLLLYIFLFLGFAIYAYLVFGDYLLSFSTMGKTLATLLTVLLGDIAYEDLQLYDRNQAGVFFVLFVAIFLLFGYNLFTAIVLDSWVDVSTEKKRHNNEHPWRVFLRSVNQGLAQFLRHPLVSTRTFFKLLANLVLDTDHKNWLGNREIASKLVHWKSKNINKDKELLDFETIRLAMRGDGKSIRKINNAQVEHLFSSCRDSWVRTKLASHNKRAVETVTAPEAGQQQDNPSRRRDGNQDTLHNIQDAFVAFKRLQHDFSDKLELYNEELEVVSANQEKSFELVQGINRKLGEATFR